MPCSFLDADGVTPLTDSRCPCRRGVDGDADDVEVVLERVDGGARRLLVETRPLPRDTAPPRAVVLTALDITDLHEQHRTASWQSEQLAVFGEASRAVLREQDARAAMCRATSR
jgi:hypothetical protein